VPQPADPEELLLVIQRSAELGGHRPPG